VYPTKSLIQFPKAKVETLLYAADPYGDGISEILTGPRPDLRAKSKVRDFPEGWTADKRVPSLSGEYQVWSEGFNRKDRGVVRC
jgi:hypothetical protein